MQMKFHHIGIAVADMDSARAQVQQCFAVKNLTDVIYDECQDAFLCMLTTKEGMKIELVSGAVVAGYIKRRQALYHSCYTVENLEEAMAELCRMGYRQISEPKPAVLFRQNSVGGGAKVVFLLGQLGLVELLEL